MGTDRSTSARRVLALAVQLAICPSILATQLTSAL